MNETVEKRKEQEKENQEKFAVQIVYNGVTKPLEVERNQHITVVLQRAIILFGITQNPHLLSSSVKTEAWYPKQILSNAPG